jgi:hypothetical protein
MKKITVILFVPLAALFSCKKDHSAPLAPGVYAVGTSENINGGPPIAAIWKNGIETELTNATAYNTGRTYATGIAILGSDIYVVGDSTSITGPLGFALLWKNGVESQLEGGLQANGITINGSDIYIVGQNALGSPCYWKNGVQTTLSQYSGIGQCIAFNGSDMYVAGVAGNPAISRQVAAYWKNGSVAYLSDSSYSAATSLAIVGNDLYVGGYVLGNNGLSSGCYWENGQFIPLTSPTPGYSVGQILGTGTDGTNIYMAGSLASSTTDTVDAGYWKNGSPVVLPSPTVWQAGASGLMVNNEDVYITGGISVLNGNQISQYAAYWKNGTAIQLSTKPASNAVALAIVP